MFYTDLTSFPRCKFIPQTNTHKTLAHLARVGVSLQWEWREVLGKDQTGDAEAYQVLK